MVTLKLIWITVILVLGLKIVMSEGMLLEKVGKFFERKIDEGYRAYDLLYCHFCMSTPCSIIAHFFAFGLGILPFEFNWQLLIRWILVLMAGSVIAGNSWNLYLMINKIKEAREMEANYFKSQLYEQDNEIVNSETEDSGGQG